MKRALRMGAKVVLVIFAIGILIGYYVPVILLAMGDRL